MNRFIFSPPSPELIAAAKKVLDYEIQRGEASARMWDYLLERKPKKEAMLIMSGRQLGKNTMRKALMEALVERANEEARYFPAIPATMTTIARKVRALFR